VIRGFFAEIINKLNSSDLQERLMQRIEDELAKVGQ
jgi:Fe-S cluster assembly protein SufD